jgi:aryl carrier-like protein
MRAETGSVISDALRARLRAQGALVDLEALQAMPVVAESFSEFVREK